MGRPSGARQLQRVAWLVPRWIVAEVLLQGILECYQAPGKYATSKVLLRAREHEEQVPHQRKLASWEWAVCSLARRRTDILRKCKVRRPHAASGAHDAARLQKKSKSARSSAFSGRQACDLLVASPLSPSQMGRCRAALRKGTQREGSSLGFKREGVKRYAGYTPPARTTGARRGREERMARELLLPFKREQRVT